MHHLLILSSFVDRNSSFATADGIAVEESGFNRRYDAETAGINSRGSFSYTAPDNTPIMVEWVADENGYRATGAHLPVAPELPDHVVKMLADLRAAGVL